jgi:MFS family permease
MFTTTKSPHRGSTRGESPGSPAQRVRAVRESLAPSKERKSSPWAVLPENPEFRQYFIGRVFSDFGTWVQNTAQVLLAYHLTHSILAVAFVTCAQFSSPLVLGPWSGVLTDRIGGMKTLVYTEIISAAIAGLLAGLEFAGLLNEAWLVTGAIVMGLAFTFALPARNVTVRRLVEPDQTRAAFAMDSVSYNLGRALAPPLSVALIAAFGFGYAFAINAVSFIIFIAVLAAAGKGTSEPERRSRVRDGFLTAYREGRIMIVLLMVVAVTVAADPVLVLGPALVSHVFGKSASWSWLFIAALGAGSVLGSLRRSKRTPSLKLAATILAALGICMIAFVLSPYFWGSVAAAGAAGAACLVANAATRTLLAKEAGPSREARVMAVWAIAWAGSKPLASLIDGSLPGALGKLLPAAISIKTTGVLLAAPTLIPILVLVFWPAFGRWLARSRDDGTVQALAEPTHATH